jgi:uncharacterized phosphatase
LYLGGAPSRIMAPMARTQPEPRGEPLATYLREVLIAGGSGGTRLYLIRHAQSEGNRGEYEHDDRDPPLSEVGREQARRLGERFTRHTVDAIYSSPARRTRATADAIAAATGHEISIVDDLREVDLGETAEDYWQYTDEQVAALREKVARDQRWDSFPAGEGSAAARRRLSGAIDRIVEEREGQRVAVVTHGAAIMTYVCHILGLDADFVFYPFNAGITSVRAKGERRVIWRLNDIAHLDGLPPGFGGIS